MLVSHLKDASDSFDEVQQYVYAKMDEFIWDHFSKVRMARTTLNTHCKGL